MTGRYEGFGPESEFEPGSRGRALRNRLGITSVRALQRRESEGLLATTQQAIDQVTVDQNFTAADVCRQGYRLSTLAGFGVRRSVAILLPYIPRWITTTRR
jgi:lysozyme family protein